MDLSWYWHRLRAMGPTEIGAHLRRKVYQLADGRRVRDWAETKLERRDGFPRLPEREDAPKGLRVALDRESEVIRHGEWVAFGHLPIRVDDPPKWHKDYLVGKDLATKESAFRLNHRALPAGADVKLVWELSRWYQLVRLAQASWVLDDEAAGQKCVRWLEDWTLHNQPYRGWNWTSALESGMRLIQFTWLDALLARDAVSRGYDAELERLWYEILPSHVWFTWRYKTVGSSANNHLLGELAGLILAQARWPGLERWGVGLEELQECLEREVNLQFHEDGGNCEQALNYQLFSWELCWQAKEALKAAGRTVSSAVEERLNRAMEFFVEVQVEEDPWDYGDSDNAFVSPVFLERSVKEWVSWGMGESEVIDYWLGKNSKPATRTTGKKRFFPDTGQMIWRDDDWVLRWDLSPLGYESTAAHGHLDALHLGIWVGGVAMVIDPGTGAYYGDKKLRAWLASREAHNSPCPVGVDFPRRGGPFLWESHHEKPTWKEVSDMEMEGTLEMPGGRIGRKIEQLKGGKGWKVEDRCEIGNQPVFTVRWQFGPGASLERVDGGLYKVTRGGRSIWLQLEGDWKVEEGNADEEREAGFAGVVSPGFRATNRAPYLLLKSPEKPCVLSTTFLVSAPL